MIGTGAMGAMLIRAHHRFGDETAFRILAANRTSRRLDALRIDIVRLATGTAAEVAAEADIVFLCLPAGAAMETAAEIAPCLRSSAVVVGIASGLDPAGLGALTGRPALKVIPSVAHAAGRGIALLVRGPAAGNRHLELVQAFMSPFSCVMVIEEADVRIATNITSCGPALFACFAAMLSAAASALPGGLSKEQLDSMARETLAGAGALVGAAASEGGQSLADLISEVATPGGNTLKALAVLNRRLPEVLHEMHLATFPAAQRARAGP